MKTKGKFHFVTGFLLGAVVFGSISAYAATEIIAKKSTQQVAINGIAVPVEAYIIDGRNYVQLRDIANKTNKFAVDYDEATSTVLIDTSKPYINFDTGEVSKVTLKPTLSVTVTSPTTEAKIIKPSVDSKLTPPTLNIPVHVIPTSQMTKAGDIIKTDTGDYNITVGKTETIEDTKGGTFPYQGEPELPKWQDEWNYTYKPVAAPDWTTSRVKGTAPNGKSTDTLYVYNAYETERMLRTIYTFAPQNIDLWEDDNPNTKIPNYSTKVTLDSDMYNNMFFPYRDSEISKQVISTGGSITFRFMAVDQYVNGIFQDTIYYMK